MDEVIVLSLYLLEVLVLTYLALLINTVQTASCANGLMSLICRASKYPIIGWIFIVLPCCLAMETQGGYFRMDPLKRIPELTHTNFKEWRFQILLAFKTAGVVCHGLYTLLKKEVISEDEKSSSSTASVKAESDAATERLALKLTERQKEYCFSLIAKTISSELLSLIISLGPDQLDEAWRRVTEQFVQTTVGARTSALGEFLQMQKKKEQRFADFVAQVEFAMAHLNSLTPKGNVVTEEQGALVLLNGVRQDDRYAVVLELIDQEQKDEIGFQEVAKKLSTVAKRVEKVNGKKELGMAATTVDPCRNFKAGKCWRGKDCKFSHAGQVDAPNSNVNQNQQSRFGNSKKDKNSRTNCDHCGKFGHKKQQCRVKEKEDRNVRNELANIVIKMEKLDQTIKER
jgi:hypothetical protein